MDKVNQEEWDATIEQMQGTSSELRDHFAHLIMTLSKCYLKDSGYKAVILVDTGASLLTFAAGANELEMAEILMHANDTVQALTMRNAPPKELFN
jgi:hypothetical protein